MTTERVVKVGADFATYAQSEDRYQNLLQVLQVMEDDRRHFQNIRESV